MTTGLVRRSIPSAAQTLTRPIPSSASRRITAHALHTHRRPHARYPRSPLSFPLIMDSFLRSLSTVLPPSAVPANQASYSIKRSQGLAPPSPTRSFSNMLMQTAVKSVTNGIMSHDDFYLRGIPAAKFSLQDPSPSPSPSLAAIFAAHAHIDPFVCVEHDLSSMSSSIEAVVGSDHPLLNKIAKYFFQVNGKRIRPAIILLMARAMQRGTVDDEEKTPSSSTIEPIDLSEVNGKRRGPRHRDDLDTLLPTQYRLAEIAEMMHTASLLHDDVIDEGDTRRGVPSVNAAYGNKFAILGGDFLLSRASVALGRLRNHDVTELMSMIIEHLVKGEILQLKNPPAWTAASEVEGEGGASTLDAHLSRYLTKTYYKTASLIANSCHSVSLLAEHTTGVQTIAYEYGRSLGLAFQVVDDILDVVGDSAVMGKAGGWDLTHGVVTAPVLYAMELDVRVRERVLRGVREEDGDEVRRMVRDSGGVERARKMAEELGENAVAAVLRLRPSVPRSALINLVHIVLNRQK